MKKTALIVLLCCLVIPVHLSAQDFNRFRLDVGAGLSLGRFDSDDLGASDNQEFADAAGFFLTLLSIRGGLNTSLRFHVTNQIGVGAELGLYTMTLSNNDSNESYTFIDIPARVVVRFGSGSTFIQGFAGNYLAVDWPIFGGLEVGAKASLGGWYISAAYTRNDIAFIRYELGYNLANVLSF